LRRRLNERFDRGAENQAFLVESVGGIRTLKSMAVEHRMQRRWEDRLAAYVSADFRCRNLGNIAQQTAGFINRLMMLAILWQGAHLVIAGALSLGQFIAFNLFAQRVSGPVLKIVQLWQEYQQAGISVRRLGDIMNTRREPGSDGQRSSLPRFEGAIAFEQVRFRYRPDAPEVLPALSFSIQAGETVGVVGPSGCGKSTLAKLIQRLYVPEAGRVLIDGIDLAAVDAGWVRNQIGVVPQENELFNGSVRENISLSHPGAEMARIERAAKVAGAHEFIMALAQGYDTQVGEQGVALSGGQRQRIAIARALLGEPRILILDEATSALDADAETHLQQRMREIALGRTLIVITHRLSFLSDARRILVMDKGRIVEQGRPVELIRAGGRFARMHARQSAGMAGLEGVS
jgi:subfamily B ATP-binding cassette protein HlyB/CyaB